MLPSHYYELRSLASATSPIWRLLKVWSLRHLTPKVWTVLSVWTARCIFAYISVWKHSFRTQNIAFSATWNAPFVALLCLSYTVSLFCLILCTFHSFWKSGLILFVFIHVSASSFDFMPFPNAFHLHLIVSSSSARRSTCPSPSRCQNLLTPVWESHH